MSGRKDSSEIDLKQTDWKDVEGIQLAQDTDLRRVVVNAIINILVQ
jgi:hypothetical protein